MISEKKGAEESNMIIFIILALVVAGLVIWFSYSFFGTGTSLIDGNDPSVQIAVESCKLELRNNPNALCTSAKTIKIRGGNKMIVSCSYINSSIRPGYLDDLSSVLTACLEGHDQAFKTSQCKLIEDSGVPESDLKKIIVNGLKCK